MFDIAISLELFLAASVIQLALGGFFGWLLRSGRPAASTETDQSKEQAQEMLQRLHALASSIGKNVGQHASRVEGINKELTEARERGDNEVEAVLLSAMAQIAESNERLQGQLRQAERKLEEQATELESKMVEARTDALTGLANRRAFDIELDHRFEEFNQSRTPACLLILDVDHFKKFNDTYGHQAGDATLRNVATVLYDSMRGVDLVARYGGEEFAVVMPNTRMSEARRLAEKARTAIAASQVDFEGQVLHVTASCGIAEVHDGLTAPELIKRADEALYASKQAGRNCVHVHDGRRCERVKSAAEHNQAAPAAGLDAAHAQASQSFEAKSPVDPLTGLMSRDVFEEDARRRLTLAHKQSEPVCLILADVDGLKQINDQFGERTGDMVLRAMSQFMNAAVRTLGDHDTTARYEGDRFAFLLASSDLRSSTETAERLRRAIALCRLRQGEGEIQFTVCLGVAIAQSGEDLPSLVGRTMQTLTAAKKSGRNVTYVANGQQIAPADEVYTDLDSEALVAT